MPGIGCCVNFLAIVNMSDANVESMDVVEENKAPGGQINKDTNDNNKEAQKTVVDMVQAIAGDDGVAQFMGSADGQACDTEMVVDDVGNISFQVIDAADGSTIRNAAEDCDHEALPRKRARTDGEAHDAMGQGASDTYDGTGVNAFVIPDCA